MNNEPTKTYLIGKQKAPMYMFYQNVNLISHF